MNKKKLSVVMAGAMLASSVAPVLAATTVEKEEVSASNLGLLISEIRDLLKSKTFTDTSKETGDINKGYSNKSVYEIRLNGNDLGLDVDSTQDDFQKKLKDLKPGQVLEVWSKGYKEEGDKVFAFEKKVPVYTTTAELNDLKTALEALNGSTKNLDAVINKVEVASTGDKLTITYESDVAAGSKLEIKLGDEKIKTTHYVTPTNVENEIKSAVAAKDFAGFVKVDKEDTKISAEKVKEITITSGGNNLTVEDLYDGLMLTTKGHDFFEEIKEAKIARGITNATKPTVVGNNGTNITNATTAGTSIVKDANGKYSFTVTVGTGKQNDLDPVTYTIVGEDEKNTERLAVWIYNELAKVDILAGANRYATAVEIAETYTGLTSISNNTPISNGPVANIVLVNGEALVDGLAAAPLAASLGSDANHKAPVLLSETDRLPKETKAYLRRALSQVTIGNVKKVTVHLVGGEAVLSNSLARELRDMGFSVERYGGANREETSLEVADAIGSKASDRVFVVGANGEAYAMSIAAVASTANTGKYSPIVVAKNGGISEDAMYELRGKDVVVIGGEKSVSDDEVTALRDEAKSVIRVSGANRQATNAAIIEKYYSNGFGNTSLGNAAKNVIVAKDGQNNKMDLVDALAAANFASEKQAPIVLATNKLSDAQINVLELNAKNAEALYQVGHGVDKDNVVKVLAQRLGLAN